MKNRKLLMRIHTLALLVFVLGIISCLNPANIRASSLHDVYWKAEADTENANQTTVLLSYAKGSVEGEENGWNYYSLEQQEADLANKDYKCPPWIDKIGWDKITCVTVLDPIAPVQMKGFFWGLMNLQKIEGIEKIDTSSVRDMSWMFNFCIGLKNIDLSSFDTRNVKNMSRMFFMTSAEEINVNSFQTGQVEDMSHMFSQCYSLTKLDVSMFDTSNVKDFTGMFQSCGALKSLNVSKFDTRNGIRFFCMFDGCSELTKLDVSHFDTSKAEDLSDMFDGCSRLTELDVSGFNTSNVTKINHMFNKCSSLKELDLSGFDTAKVNDMERTFGDCSSLTVLDLQSFDISSVTVFSNMFDGCENLERILVRCDTDWSKSEAEGVSVFANCGKLIGQSGTEYYVDNVDIPYAVVDRGDAQPGYFTAGAHTWDEGVITTEPTTEKEGVKTYTCVYCKETRTEAVEKLPSAPVKPEGTSKTKGEDGTAFGKGASLSVAEKALQAATGDKDPAGTQFLPLGAKSVKQEKTSVTVTWKKAAGASKYIVYGNVKGKAMKKLAEVTGTKAVIKTIDGGKLKKKTYYKFLVIATDQKDQVVSSSKIVYAATMGGKAGNYKSIKTAAKKNKVTVKKGKTFKLKAKAVKTKADAKVKKCRSIQYESSDPKVASVSKKGIIKGRKKGNCKVRIYLQNGVSKTIKVIVK